MSEEENEFEMFYKPILEEVSSINDDYEKKLRERGENYNIFDVLDVQRAEWVHTSILYDFLNPKGKHGCGSKFLEIFFEKILSEKLETKIDDFSRCEIHMEFGNKKQEKQIGEKDDKIDIFIDCKSFGIVIENKIDTVDHDDQLKRYWEFLQNKNYREKSYLFYLTKKGDPATQESAKGKYISLSYKDDILKWLEECKEIIEISNNPILKATLTQYILLVRKITGQLGREEMEKIVKFISKEGKYVIAAFDIAPNLEAIKKRFLEETFRPTIERLGLDFKELDSPHKEDGSCYWGSYLEQKSEPKWNGNLKIRFEFAFGKINRFYYGFHGNGNNLLDNDLKMKLEEHSKKSTRNWIIDKTLPMWYLFKEQSICSCNDTKEFFRKLVEGKDKIIEDFENDIKDLIEFALPKV